MNHEQIVKTKMAEHFNVDAKDIQIIDRLKGGMSNSNYVVSINDSKYTFRIPGKNADNFVSREIETHTLELIRGLNIDGNLLIDLDQDTGYKISHYVEGTPLMFLDPSEHYNEASLTMKKLHESKLEADNDYDPFARLEKYEQLVHKAGLEHDSSYFDIKNRFLVFRKELELLPIVICHNDSQPSNFIKLDAGGMLLVDWEFGGNNDFIYDIACFGNNDFKYAIGILPVYLGRDPERHEWKRLYLWRVFQCLQWHNVALYKEATGLSQELQLDFKMIAANYIAKANNLFAEALKWL